MIRRREFIAGIGSAAWPLAARAQQAAVPVIGFLMPMEEQAFIVQGFRKGLNEAGFVEGRNVEIDYRWAGGAMDRLPELAADLVRRRVSVIAVPGSFAAARVARAATATIPIVYGGGSDPVEAGLVASLNHPGGNVTGYSEVNTEIAPKRLGLLHDLMRSAAHFAILVDPTASVPPSTIADLQAAASVLGLQFEVLAVPSGGIDSAFASLVQKRIEAIIVSPSPLFMGSRRQLAALAARHRIAAMYWDRALVEAGGLMSYGSNVNEMLRQVGVYAGRILKGENPAEMPVQRATRFELVINRSAAKALGLDVPATLLTITDEVIE
jgi:putative tryptophan/tyrosine transport system substrate-binding protein